MKNCFRTVSGLAASVLAILLAVAQAPCAQGGFALSFDNASLRPVGSGYEIDAIFTKTGSAPASVESLLLNLRIEPTTVDAPIDGVQFLGLRNADGASVLFSSPSVFKNISGLAMFGSLINHVKVAVADDSSRRAFTVALSSTNSNVQNVRIVFADPNLYVVDPNGTAGEVQPVEFLSLTPSAPFDIQAVPEPTSCVLMSIGLGAVAVGRVLNKRKLKKLAKQ